MSNRKFTHSTSNSIREEELLFELCANIGLNYNEAFRRGVLWSAESLISTGYLPDHLYKDYISLKEEDTHHLNKRHIENIRKKTEAKEYINCPHVSSITIPSLKEDLILVFTREELFRYAEDAASQQIQQVRLVLPSLRKIYEHRTGKTLPYWNKDEEISILNQLVDIGRNL